MTVVFALKDGRTYVEQLTADIVPATIARLVAVQDGVARAVIFRRTRTVDATGAQVYAEV
jgi:hypothetical protein